MCNINFLVVNLYTWTVRTGIHRDVYIFMHLRLCTGKSDHKTRVPRVARRLASWLGGDSFSLPSLVGSLGVKLSL